MPLCPAGKDATHDFEEIGHSNSAKALLDKYLIGKFEVRERARRGSRGLACSPGQGCHRRAASSAHACACRHFLHVPGLTPSSPCAQGGDSAPVVAKPSAAPAGPKAPKGAGPGISRVARVLLPLFLLIIAIMINGMFKK